MKTEVDKTIYYQAFKVEDSKVNPVVDRNDPAKVSLRGLMGNSRGFLNGGKRHYSTSTTVSFARVLNHIWVSSNGYFNVP